jgi:hypothetical protein
MDVRYRRVSDTVCCVIDGKGYVACGREEGAALALNHSATLIWGWLRDGHTEAEIEAALCRMFGDAPSTREDIRGFLAELSRRGLVSADSGPGPGDPIPLSARVRTAYDRPEMQPLEQTEAYAFV